jgi:NhaA family Na+:H+ antiporter
MIVPAALYLSLQYGEVGMRGWGIPMATDIAFVIGCLALLGSRVPHGCKRSAATGGGFS